MKLHASLLAIGLALLGRTHEAAKPAEPRPVLVADAHFAPREEAQVLAGVIKARVESDLSFRVGGKIAARLVDAGAFVREGDALAKLDETDFRLQLEEADAELNSAKAALVQADAEERRLTTLSRQGWAANADFDRVRPAADQARRRRARRPRGRSGAQRDGLYHSARRRPRRDQRGHGRARPGRRRQRAVRPARHGHAQHRDPG
jgi:multidrug efflux pump subunit AcrA (membrane-fusion protein)